MEINRNDTLFIIDARNGASASAFEENGDVILRADDVVVAPSFIQESNGFATAVTYRVPAGANVTIEALNDYAACNVGAIFYDGHEFYTGDPNLHSSDIFYASAPIVIVRLFFSDL